MSAADEVGAAAAAGAVAGFQAKTAADSNAAGAVGADGSGVVWSGHYVRSGGDAACQPGWLGYPTVVDGSLPLQRRQPPPGAAGGSLIRLVRLADATLL